MPQVQWVSFVNALAHITSMRPAVGGQMMEADYKDLPQEALQTYLSTVLSGITAVGGEPVALDLFFENGARTRDCKVFRDVDSVLVITQHFPWKECYDMLTNPTHVGPLGPLHIRSSSATQTRLHQQKNVIPETIWQSIGPSVARQGDTVSTSSGSFVVMGNPAPYDHAVDLHPDTQYGDLPDDEPQTSSQIFTDVINEGIPVDWCITEWCHHTPYSPKSNGCVPAQRHSKTAICTVISNKGT
ncbi:hypothetical protein B0H14DRAFT_2563639 [Mycena olivaceomarginata]|nr:hypothetical protein B0H14DRAFT_2563639 [Mycena olivaceomarginata]